MYNIITHSAFYRFHWQWFLNLIHNNYLDFFVWFFLWLGRKLVVIPVLSGNDHLRCYHDNQQQPNMLNQLPYCSYSHPRKYTC
jgi:hypothetical protein